LGASLDGFLSDIVNNVVVAAADVVGVKLPSH